MSSDPTTPETSAQPMLLAGTKLTYDALNEELHRTYLEQGQRPPLFAWLLFVPMIWASKEHVAPLWLSCWLGLFFALVGIRWRICLRYRREDSASSLAATVRLVLGLRLAAALVLGGGAGFWFEAMPAYERMVFMVSAVGWYATTVIASVALPTGALLFGLALFGPIILAWLSPVTREGGFVAVLCVFVVLLLRNASETLHQAVRLSIRTRLHEQELALRLEQHGRELESVMRAKSLFLASASHDLRQPVTSMNLLLSALQAAPDEAALRRVAGKFEAPLKALEEVLTSILEVSRLEAGIIEVKRKQCTLDEILSPLVTEYRNRAAGKRLIFECEAPPMQLFTDPELLRRVIRNLVDNAIKFTEAGLVRVEAMAEDDCLVLRVLDTGPGIPEDQHARIFDDYFQGGNWHRDRKQGLGLGLGIVRRLVTMLNGEISLVSRAGHGARFTIRLQDCIELEDTGLPEELDADDAPASLPVKTVLVVEDDQLVADSLATVFGTLGITARYAMNGDDALMQTALGRFQPELAMIDYGLPGRFDGITLIGMLRPRFPNCKFLLVTGDTNPEVLKRASSEQVPVLHKPITIARLADKLKEIGIA